VDGLGQVEVLVSATHEVEARELLQEMDNLSPQDEGSTVDLGS